MMKQIFGQIFSQRLWQGIVTAAVGVAFVSLQPCLAAPAVAGCESCAAPTGQIPAPAKQVPAPAAMQYRQDRESLALRQTLQMVKHLAEQKQTSQVEQIKAQLTEQYLAPGKSTPSPEQLRMLAQIYRAAGDATQAQGLTEAWLKSFQTNEEYRAGMTPSSLLDLAKESKIIGQEAVVGSVAQAGEQWLASKMGQEQPPSFTDLCDVLELGILTDSQNLQQAARQAMAGKDSSILRKELAPFELARYSEVLAKAKDKPAQQQLANFITNDYLPTPGLADAIQPNEWVDLAKLVASIGDAKGKKDLGAMLLTRLRDDRLGLGRMPSSFAGELQMTLADLGVGDAKVRELIVRQSLGISEEAFAGLDEATRKAVLASFGDPAAWKNAEEVFCNAAKENRLPAVGYFTAVKLAAAAQNYSAARQWSKDLLEKIIADPKATPEDVALLGRLGEYTKPAMTRGQGEALAAKVAGMDSPETAIPDSVYRELAEFYPTSPKGFQMEKQPSAVQWDGVLGGQMVDKDGKVNLAVAKMLSWYYRRANYTRPFVARIYRMRMEKKPAGDAAARWMLAQTYAGSMLGEKDSSLRSSQANQGYVMALTTAQTPDVQKECLRELEVACESNHDYAKAKQMLLSIQGQLSEPMQAEVEKTLQTFAAKQADYEAQQKQQGSPAQQWYQQFQQARQSQQQWSIR